MLSYFPIFLTQVLDAGQGATLFTVFLAGLASFVSPCVLPIIPLYMSYLSGGKKVDADGNISYNRGRTMINTIFFVLGICFIYLTLAFAATSFGNFFTYQNRTILRYVGGILVIILGLVQLVLSFTGGSIGREHRFEMALSKGAMNPLVALLLGMSFSFAWSPCLGPMLAVVLSMAASSATRALGLAYMGVYCLAFAIPFLLIGFFTASLLDWLKRRRSILKYTQMIGSLLMIAMGILMLLNIFGF